MEALQFQFCPHVCKAAHRHACTLQGRLRLLKEYLTRKAAGGALAVAPADPAPDTRAHSMDASVPRERRGAVNARLAAPLPSSDSDADDESDYRSPRCVGVWAAHLIAMAISPSHAV